MLSKAKLKFLSVDFWPAVSWKSGQWSKIHCSLCLAIMADSTQTQVKVVNPSKKFWCHPSRDTIASSERGVVSRRNTKTNKPSGHIIEEVIEPLHFLGAFVGYGSPKYKTLASISSIFLLINLIISSTFIVYFTAINLYLIVYCIVAVAYTLSAGLCAYYVNTRTLPYIEKSIKALYRDKLYIDSLESVRELNKVRLLIMIL